MSQLSIAILCGGQSAEHEISILSAKGVLSALDPERYRCQVIYIAQSGRWYLVDPNQVQSFREQQTQPLMLIPGGGEQVFALENDLAQRIHVDCVVPMLHGTRGEDGSVQGLLDLLNVPYVGSNVVGSVLCMQKHIAKRLLRAADLPVLDWVMLDSKQADTYSYAQITERLGDTVFVKPAALGSSVGISKVRNQRQFEVAMQEAFQYGHQLIVERCAVGREIECSVLGYGNSIASLPGELMTSFEFYSYEAKYCDEGLQLIIPAELPEEVVGKIRQFSVDAFRVLQCSGMARVDFFLTDQEEVIINEVNTIPGFTDVSMYPKNWEASGIPYAQLMEKLINLALARFQDESVISRQYLNS